MHIDRTLLKGDGNMGKSSIGWILYPIINSVSFFLDHKLVLTVLIATLVIFVFIRYFLPRYVRY
jgi:hypothetical protein